MSTRERTIVYTCLAALFALNIAFIVGRTGSPALASPNLLEDWAAPTAAATHNEFDTLGPADALLLRASDEDTDASTQHLTLHNRMQRLSWGDSAHASTYSVGLVHVGKAMSQLVQADIYERQRRDLSEELDGRNAELRSRILALMEELRGMEQDNPQFQEKFEQYQLLDAEYQQWIADARMRMEQLEARIITDAFDDFIAAVEVVSGRRDVDIVHRFVPTDHDFEPRDRNEAQLLIRSRSLLVYPDAIDLTTAVLEELALEID